MPMLMDGEAATTKDKEHLDKRYVQLCKSTKLAEKVRDQALQVRNWPERPNKAFTQLTDTMENAELLTNAVGFALKFGKAMSGGSKLVTEEYLAYSTKGDDMVDGLVADVKVLHVHLVPAKKVAPIA